MVFKKEKKEILRSLMNTPEGIPETPNNKTHCNEMQDFYGCWTQQREHGFSAAQTQELLEELEFCRLNSLSAKKGCEQTQ